MFWIFWLLVTFLMCIFFLNFIIAEATKIYNEVNETLEEVMLREKVNMIAESEEMMISC